MRIFCLSIYNDNYDFFRSLNFIPVGLGTENFDNKWLLDSKGRNISKKNKYLGEYTFHYWLWKNYLPLLQKERWIGFCTYRRFWTLQDCEFDSLKIFKSNIIIKEPDAWKDSEVILAKKLIIGKIKTSKIIKNFGIKNTILNLNLLFKEKYNLYEHFMIFHGQYYINEAIKLLPKKEQSDFAEYLNKFSFNPHNLFICRNVKILKEFYSNIFSWLIKCENKFDMNRLTGYQIRMLGFLAEHFVSYWFQKKFLIYENHITFYDTNLRKLT